MIELRDISVAIGQKQILSDISMELGNGNWISLVGPNGAGKTTLLKVLLGVIPYGGSAHENSVEIYRNHNRSVAYIPQNPQIPNGMRVYEYVGLGTRKFDGWSRESKESSHLISDTLKDLGLWALREQMLNEISGGELQRAHLARILVQGANLVLLDEPTSALDLHHQIAVLNKLENLKREGVTIVSTMHDLTLAAMFADQIAVMSGGKLLKFGDASAMAHSPDLKAAFNNQISVYTLDSGNPVILPQRDN